MSIKITSSYKVRISNKNYNGEFAKTIHYFREALLYLIDVCDSEYDQLSDLKGKEKNNYLEKLIHATKTNPSPKYESFDKLFFSMPSYYRRNALQRALGIVSSYRSNLKNWELNPVGKKPRLNCAHFAFPAFYKKGSYNRIDNYEAQIKLYNGKTWEWYSFRLRKGDADYITHHLSEFKEYSPTLGKTNKTYFLTYAFKIERDLRGNELNQTICAVDLGINNAATCVAMLPDGTVIGRKIISLPREKGCLEHSIGYIKKAQQAGNYKTPRLWAFAKGINKNLSSKTAKGILDFASYYDCETIVFEHLDTRGKKRGSKKQKLTLWRHQEVQAIVTHHAHLLNMRISRVCAWGTSALAFDGSGRVERNVDGNYSICKFPTGKIYHADLNAAYNIGARFFIRYYCKSMSEKRWSELVAKVSTLSDRTCGIKSAVTRTLSDLVSLNAELIAQSA
jgi:transposase